MSFGVERTMKGLGLVFVVCSLCSVASFAAGISVDAGLTPAEDRWIFRMQFRHMQRNDDPTAMDRELNSYAVPFVLAYGLRRNLTVLARQTVFRRELSRAGPSSNTTGLDDLFVMGKYKLYRRNTSSYIFGSAVTFGLGAPTGAGAFTSDTWDLRPGLYLSWRRGSYASDFNATYTWKGFADDAKNGTDPGDELALDWAIAYQFSIGEKSRLSLTPVAELSYRYISPDHQNGNWIDNTGESILLLSPGIKFTRSSLILEALLQIPVSQEQRGLQMKRANSGLVGVRYMF